MVCLCVCTGVLQKGESASITLKFFTSYYHCTKDDFLYNLKLIEDRDEDLDKHELTIGRLKVKK